MTRRPPRDIRILPVGEEEQNATLIAEVRAGLPLRGHQNPPHIAAAHAALDTIATEVAATEMYLLNRIDALTDSILALDKEWYSFLAAAAQRERDNRRYADAEQWERFCDEWRELGRSVAQ